MADPQSGLDVLQAQVKRRSRAVPPPRHPRAEHLQGDQEQPQEDQEQPQADQEQPQADQEQPQADEPQREQAHQDQEQPQADQGQTAPDVPPLIAAPSGGVASGPPRPTAPPRRRPPKQSATDTGHDDDRPTTSPNEPVSNLAVRVRRSLDSRLDDLVHSFKQDGVRVSKVEIVEMLLWELPADASPEFRRRLAAFRQAAPREERLL